MFLSNRELLFGYQQYIIEGFDFINEAFNFINHAFVYINRSVVYSLYIVDRMLAAANKNLSSDGSEVIYY